MYDKASGDLLATLEHLTFCRGDGGFSDTGNGPSGGDPAPAAKPATPDTPPDLVCDMPTMPQAALIYRLMRRPEPAARRPRGGQRRRLQAADPARPGQLRRGRPRDAGRCCDYDPVTSEVDRPALLGPVYPGETLRVEMWRRGSRVHFRVRVVERDVVVLNNGIAEIA